MYRLLYLDSGGRVLAGKEDVRPRGDRVHPVNGGLGHLPPHVADGGLAHDEEEEDEDGPADEVGDQVDGDAAIVVANLEGVRLVEPDTAGGLIHGRHCCCRILVQSR